MGIALGGPDRCMAKQSPDHFQRGATGDQQGGEGMAQIVDADVGDFGPHPHPLPEALEIDHGLAWYIAGEEEGAALRHSITAQADRPAST